MNTNSINKLALLVVLAGAATVTAAPAHWDIDAAHTTVGFSIKHMMVSNVSGTFGKVEGGLDVDPADPATASVKAEIETTSVSTGNGKRDDHLRSPDFFDTAKFPKISFASKKIEKDGEKLKMTGDLTMHGVTKEVTLDVEVTQPVNDPWGNTRRGATASGKLNRKDFGLVWSKTMDGGGVVLGDDVKLTIDVELVAKKDAPASPAPSAK